MKSISEYKSAVRRGYVSEDMPLHEFEISLVGQWCIKHGNRIKELDIMRDVFGCGDSLYIPTWEDLTERNLKHFRDAVVSRVCANSARQTFAKLKAIMNDMKNEVELPCERFADILRIKAEPSQNVYLTEEELSRLASVSTEDKYEQYVKCLCLISSYTGCRHSDALRMTIDNINLQTNMLSYVSQKTHVEANIPVHRNLYNVLNGYDRSISMFDYEFNDIIRKLCKRCGIDALTKMFHAGKEEIKPKYEFIASHTFRRTFATLLYQRGCDVPQIGRLMGHTGDTKVTMGYIVGYKELSHNAMSFFN